MTTNDDIKGLLKHQGDGLGNMKKLLKDLQEDHKRHRQRLDTHGEQVGEWQEEILYLGDRIDSLYKGLRGYGGILEKAINLMVRQQEQIEELKSTER